MSGKVKLGELYFDYQVGDEPISEIDNVKVDEYNYCALVLGRK